MQFSVSAVCIQVGAVFIACRYSTLSVAMATGEVICQQNVLNCLPLVIPNDNERDINTWQWHIQLSTWPVPRPGLAATLSSVCDMKQTRRVSESSRRPTLEMSQLSKKQNQSIMASVLTTDYWRCKHFSLILYWGFELWPTSVIIGIVPLSVNMMDDHVLLLHVFFLSCNNAKLVSHCEIRIRRCTHNWK